jgi:hypothetical protein
VPLQQSKIKRRLIIVYGYSGKYYGNWTSLYVSDDQPDPREQLNLKDWERYSITEFFSHESMTEDYLKEFPGSITSIHQEVPPPGRKDELIRLSMLLRRSISVFVVPDDGADREFLFTIKYPMPGAKVLIGWHKLAFEIKLQVACLPIYLREFARRIRVA